MQIKFFDDNIFCNLKPTDSHTIAQCEVCGVTYSIVDPQEMQEIKIPCYRKIQNVAILEIDKDYKPEPIGVIKHKAPNIVVKAFNFIKALYKHIVSGAKRTSASEREKRYEICKACEFFDGSACTKCGCPISRHARFISKLDWSDQHCPINKW